MTQGVLYLQFIMQMVVLNDARCSLGTVHHADGYLLTWILGVASKQLRLLNGRVGDSTVVVN